MAAARLAVIANPFLSLNRISQVRSLRCNNGVSLSVSKRLFTCRALHNPQLHVKEQGQPETLDYRVFFLDSSGKTVSPWHDLPLHLGDGIFNFIAEIPKESSAKMEVATDEPYTPIKQDTKKGKLRYYPYNINWNYGLLPQTWEDPSLANSEVEGAFGDNDPVDVVEIGESRAKIGQILRVKPLGALAMIDEGELDWKIVAISLDDPRASLVNDVDDVEKHFPPSWSDYQPYRICDHVTVKWLFNQSFKSERGNFLNQRYLSHGIIWKGKTETRALLLQLETGLETIRSLMENQLTSSVWATRQQTRIMPSR